MAEAVCEQCGSPVRDGEPFCGNCGVFLEWDREPAPTGQAAAAHPQPVAGPPAAPGAEVPSASAVIPAAAPPVPAEAAPAPPTPAADPATSRAAALLVPVQPARHADPPEPHAPETAAGTVSSHPATPSGDQPGAVQPGRPVPRRPTVRTYSDDRDPTPDDIACPACGTANRPDRNFCRRCGAALGGPADRARRLPWWRRWRRRPRPARSLLWRVLTWLLIIALLAALGYAAFVFGRKATDAIRDKIAKPVPVHPTFVHASSEAPGHPAASAADGLSNRYWAPARTGPAQGEYVEFAFAGPVRLLDLIVHTGAAADQDVFLGQARPAELGLTAWTAGGDQVHTTLHLEDRLGEQKFHQVIGDVVHIRLTIKSDYGDAPERRVALGEVEFFKRP
ncbi:zinc-ribbon domain-containing protein [Frankia sp. CiP3]|uniref:NADase-type glycan-binding domain-containing protein n=1 Tax=Frankia sp. CiP3 TaxID=2880971 RepID=UPI001EF6B4B3|nr:zinc-ribbon domain-containing protein [Frankia sp. CiP3]